MNSDYINYIRIYNSFFELKKGNKKIINIAYNNGFYSLEYFSEMFNISENSELTPQEDLELNSLDIIIEEAE